MRVCHPEGFRSGDVGRYLEKFHRLVLEEPPQALRSGRDRAVWRLATRGGEYLARIFTAERLAAVRAEIDLLDYLADSGMRTPHVLKNRHGQRAGRIGARLLPAFLAGACPIVVTLREDGRRLHPQTVTRPELARVARCIGLMHEALQAYPRRAGIRRLAPWSPDPGRFEDLLGSPNAASFASHELTCWSELDRAMAQAVAEVHDVPLTDSVLHGDLALEHVRLLHAGTRARADVYVFDSSDFCYGPVVCDLAVMLVRLYVQSEVSLGRWEQLHTWLLEGYDAGLLLRTNDRRVLHAALMERLLIEIRHLNRTSLDRRAPYSPEGVRKRYALGAYLLERRAGRRPGLGPSAAS